jgi:hypothetical protein
MIGKLAVSLLVIILYCLALEGWGVLVCRIGHVRRQPWPVVTTVGLACWIFLGGLLNLFRLAHAGALDAVVISGWGLCALHVWSHRDSLRDDARGLIMALARVDVVAL